MAPTPVASSIFGRGILQRLGEAPQAGKRGCVLGRGLFCLLGAMPGLVAEVVDHSFLPLLD